MEYVLSNGNFYVKVAKTGRIDKVPNTAGMEDCAADFGADGLN